MPLGRGPALAAAGYGVNLTLLSALGYGLPALLSRLPASWDGAAYAPTVTVSLVGTLALVGLRGLIDPRPLSDKTALAALPLLASGYGAVALAPVLGAASSATTVVGACAASVAAAVMFALWQQVLAGMPLPQARRCVMLGGVEMPALWAVLALCPSAPVLALALVALCAADWLLLRRLMSLPDGSADPPQRIPDSSAYPSAPPVVQLKGTLASIWRYILCAGVIGFSSVASRSFISEGSPLTVDAFFAISTLAASLFLLLLERHRPAPPLRGLYGGLLMITAGCFVFAPMLGEAAMPAVAAVSYLAFSVASMLMVISSIEVARFRNVSPTFVFGFFVGGVYLISDVLPLVVNAIGQGMGLSRLVVVSLTAVYLLSFAGMIIGIPWKGTVGPEPDLPDGEVAAAPATAAPRDAVGVPDRFTRTVSQSQDLIPACCQELRAAYRLTDRETEVLELIARGRNLARIAEMLYVSPNTVRSHCRNLYRKLGVHDRQGVLDLMEDARKGL